MPYGMDRQGNGWVMFNRNYEGIAISGRNVHFRFNRIPTESALLKLAGKNSKGDALVQRDEKGDITRVYFYDDGSVPFDYQERKRVNTKDYKDYCGQLQYLAEHLTACID